LLSQDLINESKYSNLKSLLNSVTTNWNANSLFCNTDWFSCLILHKRLSSRKSFDSCAN